MTKDLIKYLISYYQEKREVDALVKLNKVLPMRQLTIITKEEERNIMAGDVAIHAVPVWKWILDV